MLFDGIFLSDENKNPVKFSLENNKITVKREDIAAGTQSLFFEIPAFDGKLGDAGYYLIPDAGNTGSQICLFGEKEDGDFTFKQNLMPVFGVKTEEETYFAIVSGMQFAFFINFGKMNGKYYLRPVFNLNGDTPYEDIVIEFFTLGKSADYSDMARFYRERRLVRGECAPISEKCKTRPELAYAAESIEIRVRLGWKPAPPKIEEQTLENEPEMAVGATFDRVKDFVDELFSAGVRKAEICLVGWNVSGHDGRYPDMFPVEEKLGGEERLRALISHAQKLGYLITCHTNSSDCYSISKDFSPDIVIKKKDMSPSVNAKPYSGGKMYHLCPKIGLDFAKRDLPRVAELGFRGLHYVDVMTFNPIRTCYDPKHPVTAGETAEYFKEIMRICHKEFGGFSSEGAYDAFAEYLDYAYCVSYSDRKNPIFDYEVPFFELVYHGIILANTRPFTVNCMVKGKKSRAMQTEHGARPTFYINSRFYDIENESPENLDATDLLIATDEQLKRTVAKIKAEYEGFWAQRHLQKEFMQKHEYINENLRRITYSDGTVISVSYEE